MQLSGWDGSVTFPGFEKLLRDLKARLEPAPVEEPVDAPSLNIIFERLPTPKLEPVATSFVRFTLRWTTVHLAIGYVLEMSYSGDFSDAEIKYEGQESSFGSYGGIMNIADIGSYRVKAKGRQFVFRDSEWSNLVRVHGSTMEEWLSGSQ